MGTLRASQTRPLYIFLSQGPYSRAHRTCLGYSGPILSPGPWSPHTTCLGYSGPILSPCRSLVTSYDMPEIQWAYSIPMQVLSHLIRHAWDTVGLFYPWPLVTSYNMPGIQWTYSIPGPLVASYNMHAWDTVGLFYPWALVTSYDIPGIQWAYSIPGPLVTSYNMHAWDTVGLFYPGPLVSAGWGQNRDVSYSTQRRISILPTNATPSKRSHYHLLSLPLGRSEGVTEVIEAKVSLDNT